MLDFILLIVQYMAVFWMILISPWNYLTMISGAIRTTRYRLTGVDIATTFFVMILISFGLPPLALL